MTLSSPVALVIQPSPVQAQLWAQALGSQGIQVIQESPRSELMEYISRHQPDVLIVDMTTGLFNPYGFCRDCRGEYPGLPLILTHPPEQTIEAAARRWAIYQGAAEVMPGLSRNVTILDSVYQVLSLMGIGDRFNDQALLQSLKITVPSPVEELRQAPPSVEPEELPEVLEVANSRPSTAARTQRMFRGRPVA